jgi:hypothetical protein
MTAAVLLRQDALHPRTKTALRIHEPDEVGLLSDPKP